MRAKRVAAELELPPERSELRAKAANMAGRTWLTCLFGEGWNGARRVGSDKGCSSKQCSADDRYTADQFEAHGGTAIADGWLDHGRTPFAGHCGPPQQGPKCGNLRNCGARLRPAPFRP